MTENTNSLLCVTRGGERKDGKGKWSAKQFYATIDGLEYESKLVFPKGDAGIDMSKAVDFASMKYIA